MSFLKLLLALGLCLHLAATDTEAEDLSRYVGQKVMPKDDAKIIAPTIRPVDQFPLDVRAVDGERLDVGSGEYISYKDILTLEEAIPYFTERIQEDPKNVMSLFNRGIARLYRGDYDQGKADLDAAIKLDEASPPAKRVFKMCRLR